MAHSPLFLILALLILLVPVTVSSSAPGIIVTCFNCGIQIERATAVAAANQFCAAHWKKTIQQSGSLASGVVFNYSYQITEFGYKITRSLRLSVIPFWNGENGCNADYNPFFVDDKTCYTNVMAPIDYCNTSGENAKQGGYWLTGCANVTINPSPNDPPCPNAAPNWTPPGAEVLTYLATSEEYNATVAAVLRWEEARGSYAELNTALSTIRREFGTP